MLKGQSGDHHTPHQTQLPAAGLDDTGDVTNVKGNSIWPQSEAIFQVPRGGGNQHFVTRSHNDSTNSYLHMQLSTIRISLHGCQTATTSFELLHLLEGYPNLLDVLYLYEIAEDVVKETLLALLDF